MFLQVVEEDEEDGKASQGVDVGEIFLRFHGVGVSAVPFWAGGGGDDDRGVLRWEDYHIMFCLSTLV